MTPEFSRPVRIDSVGPAPFRIQIEAEADERAALARRFDLVAIDALDADLTLTRFGDQLKASGIIGARVIQSCVASGDPVPTRIHEPFALVFSPQPAPGRASDEEIELSESDCDVIFYTGAAVDVGEAVAETLSLILDPWPRALHADAALTEAGVTSRNQAGPFAALAGLRDRLKK